MAPSGGSGGQGVDGAPAAGCGAGAPAALAPMPLSTALHVTAMDVAASSPISQPGTATKPEGRSLAGGAAAPSKRDRQDSAKAAAAADEAEELAPGQLPKLPWRENPLLTKVPQKATGCSYARRQLERKLPCPCWPPTCCLTTACAMCAGCRAPSS